MARYAKALAAVAVGLATAATQLPPDAPRWLLLAGAAVNGAIVWAVRNKPAPRERPS